MAATQNYSIDTIPDEVNVAAFTIRDAYSMEQGGMSISDGTETLTIATVFIHITSTEAVADFTSSDIIVAGGCKVALRPVTGTPTNTQWRLEVGITADTAGILTIAIPANIVNIGNALEEKQFEYNRQTSEPDSPHLRLLDLPDAQVSGRIVTLRLQSYLGDEQTDIDGLTADDIIVTSDDDVIHRLS